MNTLTLNLSDTAMERLRQMARGMNISKFIAEVALHGRMEIPATRHAKTSVFDEEVPEFLRSISVHPSTPVPPDVNGIEDIIEMKQEKM